MLAFYEHRFPIAPGTDSEDARAVHEAQSYRLVPWNSGIIGYRRFFAVSDLAGIRQEDPRVFDASHRELQSWIADDLVDGVRIDHPDGLADPAGYLDRLRAMIGPDRWLVIEKILGHEEPLDDHLPIDGTTGYDALAELGGVFLDSSGAPALTALSAARTEERGDSAWLRQREPEIKREVASTMLAPEVRRLVRAILREADGDYVVEDVRDAVIAVVAAMPVYRSDYSPLAGLAHRVIGSVVAEEPHMAEPLAALASALIRGVRRPRGSTRCAVRSWRNPSRTACSIAPLASSRSRKWVVIPRRWACPRRVPPGVRRAGDAVAEGDDHPVHPRHQAR